MKPRQPDTGGPRVQVPAGGPPSSSFSRAQAGSAGCRALSASAESMLRGGVLAAPRACSSDGGGWREAEVVDRVLRETGDSRAAAESVDELADLARYKAGVPLVHWHASSSGGRGHVGSEEYPYHAGECRQVKDDGYLHREGGLTLYPRRSLLQGGNTLLPCSPSQDSPHPPSSPS